VHALASRSTSAVPAGPEVRETLRSAGARDIVVVNWPE
jgi:hypothetical protein